jgi:predicted kinase
MGTGKTSLASSLESERGWHLVGSDAVRKRLAGIDESTRMWVPYNAGIYSPEMTERTYGEMNRIAESLLTADLPVVMDGSFKSNEERLRVLEMARRVGAEVLFVETTCDEEEQRRRLESRQRTDTRSDGRIELMENQRQDFDDPSGEVAAVYHRLPTGRTEDEARTRLDGLLAARGMDGGE